MTKNAKILNLFLTLGLMVTPLTTMAQGQFIDCSKGNGQCDMLYSSEGNFLNEDCTDCVQGQIKVEPAVVKTSYRALASSMPNAMMESQAVNVTRQVKVEGRKRGAALRENEKVGGVWITHEMDEKIAYGQDVHDWEAARGETLKSLLTQWAEVSGWTLIWKLDRDYNLEAGVVFRGTFTEVSSAIIRTFARATPAPIGTFYKGNRVLVISIQEDENAH